MTFTMNKNKTTLTSKESEGDESVIADMRAVMAVIADMRAAMDDLRCQN